MAILTNTQTTYGVGSGGGNREELADIIYMQTPEETPLMTMIGRSSVVSTHPEWLIDTLATPGANAKVEGDEWTYQAIAIPTRVGNYTQIADKRIIISETQEVVNKAGRKSELKREIRKRGAELKLDMEYALLANQASVAGNTTTARQSAGFPAWLTTNDQRGTGGADGGFSGGLVAAATTGTLRAFTKTLLDDALAASYSSGGTPKYVMVSPYNKRVFSGFAGIAELRSEIRGNEQATIYAGADAYVSDFGMVTIVPNRVMAGAAALARRALIIDPTMASVGILRDIQLHQPAKTGDAEKRVLNVEFTLKMNNEAAHATVEDIFGLTAAT
jgi:hypothetical protein